MKDSNFTLLIRFGKSKSPHFREALSLAKGLPNFVLHQENGAEYYECTIDSIDSFGFNLHSIIKLLFLIQKWKSCSLFFNGTLITYNEFYEIKYKTVAQHPEKSFYESNISFDYVVLEKLPFPYVFYPSFGGTFMGFAEERNSTLFLCSCSKEAVQSYYDNNFGTLCKPNGFYEFFPKYFIEASGFLYKENICHKCNKATPYFQYSMYGTKFIQNYGWYVNQEYLRHGLNPYVTHPESVILKIENAARAYFGFKDIGSYWLNETKMFYIIKSIYPKHEIIRHYRPEWLNRLELDVFIPALNLAFEYQGEQHFIPIMHWGGEIALANQQKNDKKKAEICKERGILLLYINYYDEMSVNFIENLIKNSKK